MSEQLLEDLGNGWRVHTAAQKPYVPDDKVRENSSDLH